MLCSAPPALRCLRFGLEAVKVAAAPPASRCCPTAGRPPPTSRLRATSTSQTLASKITFTGSRPSTSSTLRGAWMGRTGVPTRTAGSRRAAG
uniref:Actin binding LIM protein family member 2 n=1 Tax=Myotis myotis TaxID=51298 RepID=A0A7J8AGW9_MYOMY|nr:actin binding LIM protein family member 2 [Myotis myotis]